MLECFNAIFCKYLYLELNSVAFLAYGINTLVMQMDMAIRY